MQGEGGGDIESHSHCVSGSVTTTALVWHRDRERLAVLVGVCAGRGTGSEPPILCSEDNVQIIKNTTSTRPSRPSKGVSR